MILVDSSVWIAVFRKRKPFDLEAHVDFEEVVACLPVIQEVLQGFREESAFRVAESAMSALPVVDSPLPGDVFRDAVDLYRTGRSVGRTVRSSVDCLIAASALRHDLEVLHADRDFEAIATFSALRQTNIV